MGRDQPDLRAAYRAAWADRASTGDVSDEVLIRRLRLEGITELPPVTEEQVLAVWRRGVPPSRMVWALVSDGLRPVVRAYSVVAHHLWDAFHGEARPSLTFTPTLPVGQLLRLSESWPRDEYADELRVVDVELVADPDQGWFGVTYDGQTLGRAHIEDGRAERGPATLYLRVEDGQLDSQESWIDQP